MLLKVEEVYVLGGFFILLTLNVNCVPDEIDPDEKVNTAFIVFELT